MCAKAILVAKLNSLQFEDRVLLLDVPAKIGRSHKDEQVNLNVLKEYNNTQTFKILKSMLYLFQ